MNTFQEIMDEFKQKISKEVLPPDPARVIKEILDFPAGVEHATPLPPVIETIHKDITIPLIEKLPRLPLTGDFPKESWEKW